MTQSPATDPDATPATDVPEQVRVRTAKRAQLLEAGIEPYPVQVPVTHTIAEVRERWGHLETGEETTDEVGVAGRVVFVRNTGKLCFASIQSGDGTRLQVMLSLAVVGEESLASWKSLVDLGDHVFVHGRVISSRRGELSVMATSWQMASKSLRPLPVLHKELSEEQRVRRRYVDLIVRDEARQMVLDRAAVIRAIRRTLEDDGFIEIETPVLQSVHGGATARPFHTHLNAFDLPVTMRIALELHLKRAVVGGIERVYEIGRVFRNEGIDSSHSPEFTMLEAYQAYGDQTTMADLTQRMILAAADAMGGRQIDTPEGVVDLDGEWRWLPFYEALSAELGMQIDISTKADELTRLAAEREVPVDPSWDEQKIALELFGELVEPHIIQPTFVCDFPAAAQPLARPHRSEPGVIEAWDLIIGGTERGTAFSELIDPVIQRERLMEQSRRAAQGDDEAMELDEDFLRALEHAAPPMGGLGIGIDRVLMLLAGVGIRETILFPFVKPEA
ncbi:lysine--tRNA ligase [Ornithinimicrobium cryptoxanthini]|uniref:Lysine--tRNA ligase n=1 Tax=Ornithinimicrobium cryptoxanthini TaxID=2934161 RepID=A0ABY4YJ04_9MICO|nr:lysine--tRNA ligase [Ornithinimicrobium cryptoxanthini]USQ76726.1 lysine--tRNA ligase [Ornithinimicrobium cryptoxanthini]